MTQKSTLHFTGVKFFLIFILIQGVLSKENMNPWDFGATSLGDMAAVPPEPSDDIILSGSGVEADVEEPIITET
ncbi:hypothetical protein DOZ52_29050 [Enterobacter hormaechei]|nr:hypothetical protein DOZ52_29050 [Enterobacter hormaechei]